MIISREAARDRSREALMRVGIASPDERMRAYPHQFSGGMRQRVIVAIAGSTSKSTAFSTDERVALAETVLSPYANVDIARFDV